MSLFEASRQLLRRIRGFVVGVTASGGHFGAEAGFEAASRSGVGAFLKSLAQERDQLRVRVVDCDVHTSADLIAQAVVGEVLATDAETEVGYRNGQRSARRLRSRSRDASPYLRLSADDVILITGAARGITAQVAIALARRYGCRLELVSRSRAPDAVESDELARCRDARSLRAALINQAGTAASPRAIEVRVQQVVRERELRSTFAALDAAGCRYRYHSLDVSDGDALAALVREIYAQHGRMDGVVHGAGVIDDRLVLDKSADSFARVLQTKSRAAVAILRSLPQDAKFVAFFSSVSGFFGNPGQTDYAAANERLDRLAICSNRPGRLRALSVNWGPWAGVGMVTDAMEQRFRDRGIDLLDARAAVNDFLEELVRGRDPQVVLTAGNLDAWLR